jgi:hypothetical protein
MIKRVWGLFLAGALSAAPLPKEEGVIIYEVSPQLVIHVKNNHMPPMTMAVRVAYLEHEAIVGENFVTLAGDFDDAAQFLRGLSRKSLEPNERAAVVIVGDFSSVEMALAAMGPWAAERFSPALIPLGDAPLTDEDKAVLVRTSEEGEKAQVVFGYITPIRSIEERDDLRHRWIVYMIQEMLKERLKGVALACQGEIKVPHESPFLFPEEMAVIEARCPHDRCVDLLTGYLLAMQEIRKSGFTFAEFDRVRIKIQRALNFMYCEEPAHEVLAEYYADHALMGLTPIAYGAFVKHSVELLGEIRLREVHGLINQLLKDDVRTVRMALPTESVIAESNVVALLEQISADSFSIPTPEDPPPPPPVIPVREVVNHYALLPLAPKHDEMIRKMITTIAETHPVALWPKRKELEKMGDEIESHVHPFRFMGTIFTRPELKRCMREIIDSRLKWGEFSQGFARRMFTEARKNNLAPYYVGFCQAVKVRPDEIRPFFEKADWGGLLKYLAKTPD